MLGAARARFGGNGLPVAIIMTHAHFDHVGALKTLAGEWDVPVYRPNIIISRAFRFRRPTSSAAFIGGAAMARS
ncbi:MBL fold metallo-hydrolase [Bradyrhizobium arachidis]|uniref:MBL fold metallo-hydrolase n=1 Tax=Bradyrhizobium TaxID=374 RepID=UPI0004246B90